MQIMMHTCVFKFKIRGDLGYLTLKMTGFVALNSGDRPVIESCLHKAACWLYGGKIHLLTPSGQNRSSSLQRTTGTGTNNPTDV